MRELISFGAQAIFAHRLRSGLSMLGIAIGIAAVVLLTSIGEGTRQYVLGQFTQFGTNLLSIAPGKTETLGVPGILGGTTHKLTLDDAVALKRIPGVVRSMPVTYGQARVEAGGRGRSVYIYGVTAEMPEVWKFEMGFGSPLPAGDAERRSNVVLLGPTLQRELFGDENPLGEFVRAAGTRLRVIGIMAPKGDFLGRDIDDAAYVPVATHFKMFNQDELNEIHVTFLHEGYTESVVTAVREILMDRHDGREDFMITTQDAMLDVFGKVMDVITVSVGAIGAISLIVGAIGILTTMWIAVGERTSEIGLLRALGASARQVLSVFLAEAVVLALLGGVLGVAVGLGLSSAVRSAVPALPLQTPAKFVLAAVIVSAATGLLSGVLPARRAAALDPVDALRAE